MADETTVASEVEEATETTEAQAAPVSAAASVANAGSDRQVATPDTTTAPSDPTTVDATGTNSGETGERRFTQAELDKAIKERLERQKESYKKATSDAVTAKETELQELLGKANSERDEAKAEASKDRIALWQLQAAIKVGLPMALAERLKGETAKEMEADAKTMLEAMPKPPAPNINAQNGPGAAPAAGQMSDAEKMDLAAVLGVNPKYM